MFFPILLEQTQITPYLRRHLVRQGPLRGIMDTIFLRRLGGTRSGIRPLDTLPPHGPRCPVVDSGVLPVQSRGDPAREAGPLCDGGPLGHGRTLDVRIAVLPAMLASEKFATCWAAEVD